MLDMFFLLASLLLSLISYYSTYGPVLPIQN